MVGTGILTNHMRSPSPEGYTTFWTMTIYSDTLHRYDIAPIFYHYWSRPYNRILLFTQLCEVSIEHLQRVRHANRGRLLLRTPGPFPLWDLHVFLCRDQSLLNLICFRTFEFRTSLGTSLLLWTSIECAITFRMIVQLPSDCFTWRRPDRELLVYVFQWSLEREFMYFAGKLVYLIVLASDQLAVTSKKVLLEQKRKKFT